MTPASSPQGRAPSAADAPTTPAAIRAAIDPDLMRARVSHTWVRIALLVGLVAIGVIAARSDHLGVRLAGVIPLAIVFATLFSAVHESSHGSLFRTRAANDAFGLLCGAVALVPYAGYRVFHLDHHARTHVEDDTEPVTIIHSVLEWVAVVAVSMFWMRGLVIATLPRALRSRNRRTRVLAGLSIGLTACSSIAVVALAIRMPQMFVWAWLLPFLAAAIVGSLFTIPEHYGCAYGPASAFVTTRSVRSNALGRFIMWNGNYHTEHHLLASVPSSRLPEFHRLVAPELGHYEPSYLRYHVKLLGQIRRRELPAPPPWEHRPDIDLTAAED